MQRHPCGARIARPAQRQQPGALGERQRPGKRGDRCRCEAGGEAAVVATDAEHVLLPRCPARAARAPPRPAARAARRRAPAHRPRLQAAWSAIARGLRSISAAEPRRLRSSVSSRPPDRQATPTAESASSTRIRCPPASALRSHSADRELAQRELGAERAAVQRQRGLAPGQVAAPPELQLGAGRRRPDVARQLQHVARDPRAAHCRPLGADVELDPVGLGRQRRHDGVVRDRQVHRPQAVGRRRRRSASGAAGCRRR